MRKKRKMNNRFNRAIASILAIILMLSAGTGLFSYADDAEGDTAVHYDMSFSGGYLTDISGNGLDAELVGLGEEDICLDPGGKTVLNFYGDNNQYVKLPDGIIPAKEEFTIETIYKTENTGAGWMWTLGTKKATWSQTSNYMFINPSENAGTVRTAIVQGIAPQHGERRFDNDESLGGEAYQAVRPALKRFHNMTASFSEGNIKVYLDGELIGEINHSYTVQEILGQGVSDPADAIGYIGRSLYIDDDPGFTGMISEFKVYNYTMSDEEAKERGQVTDNQIVKEAAAVLDIPNSDDIRGNITLPEELYGADITWSSPDNSAEGVIDLDGRPVNNPNGYEEYPETVPIGTVTRQNTDKTVRLNAEISSGQSSIIKEFTITVVKAAEEINEYDYEAYLFTHFVGTEGFDDEQIYFSVSEDGYDWDEINGSEIILRSEIGDKGVRDPYLIRSPEGDRFFMIATDLNINLRGGWGNANASTGGSTNLVVWESNDLVNWSEPWLVDVKPGAGSAWAPEIIYDEMTGEYIVFWASWTGGTDGDIEQAREKYRPLLGNEAVDSARVVNESDLTRFRIYYAKTRDFRTMSEAEELIDRNYKIEYDGNLKEYKIVGHTVIDTTMIKVGDTYYRASADGQITFEKSDNLLSMDWEYIGTLEESTGLTGGHVEGPEFFKLNKKDSGDEDLYFLMVDQYSAGHGYLPLTGDVTDHLSWQVPSEYNLGTTKKRHGGFLNITKAEYDALREAYPNEAEENTEPEQKEPIVDYDFEDQASNSTIADKSGDNNAQLFGNAVVQYNSQLGSNVLYLDGTDGTYLEFPQGFFDGRNTMTVSMDVYSQMGGDGVFFFTFTFGKNTTKQYFLRTRSNQVRSVITKSGNTGEEVTTVSGSYGNKWMKVDVVFEPGIMKLYVDGVLVDQNTNISTMVTELGWDLLGYLGKSFYNDAFFKGYFDNVRVYNRALSAEEIAGEEPEGLMNIQVTSMPAKTVYALNEEFNSAGLEVTASYYNGSDRILDSSEYTLSGFDSSQSGTKTITVTYTEDGETKKTSFKVTVSEDNSEAVPVLEYDFESVSGSVVYDQRGTNHAVMHNNASIQYDSEKDSNVLYLDGSDGTYLELPTGFFDGRDHTTISMDIKTQMADSDAFFTLSIGQDTDVYMFLRTRPSSIRNAITVDSYGNEQAVAVNGSYGNTWVNVKIVLDKDRMDLYVNNMLVDSSEVTIGMSDLGGNLLAYIGKSFYKDKFLKGYIDNVRVYDSALSEDEIGAMDDEAIRGITIASMPDKTEYEVGEILDHTGLKVEAEYFGGNTVELNPSQFTLSSPAVYIAGKKTITISYKHNNVVHTASFKIVVNSAAAEAQPVLAYDFENISGNTVKDLIGNNDAVLYGAAKTVDDEEKESSVLYLDGSDNTYAQLPTGFFDGRDVMTISMDIKTMAGESDAVFTFALGLSDQKYMFLRSQASTFRNAITVNGYQNENAVSAFGTFREKWVNVKLVIVPGEMYIYIDGELEGMNSSQPLKISDIGNNLISYIGKSFFSADPYYKGYFDNFEVYDYAFSEEEVASMHNISIYPFTNVKADSDQHSISAAVPDRKTREINVYISKSNSHNTDLSGINFSHQLKDDFSSDLADEIVLDLNQPQTLTVESDMGTDVWTIKGILSNNPVLGGQFADPDIDVFDGRYYIYPTTDGTSGWKGTQFKVFSSADLVNWVDEGFILDVSNDYINGADNENGIPGVPWSVDSAWAPTIEEKNGKYYYYFCAKERDVKDTPSAIGVAVADNPTGPFVAMEEPLVTIDYCRNVAGITMGQAIDPSIYTEPDTGISYMYFGNGNAAVVELNDDMVSLKAGTMKNISGLTDFRESVIVNKGDGMYHFTWSCDDTGSENYRVNYGVSASLYGPVEFKYTMLSKDKSKDILGTGHHDILEIPGSDSVYIVYHRFVTPLGQYTSGFGYHRETCIDKVEFDENGYMSIVTPTHEGITEPVYVPGYEPGEGADKYMLGLTIKYAQGLAEKYPAYLIEQVKEMFEEALLYAVQIYEKENATQQEVDEADENLIAMIHYLSFTANYDKLTEALEEAYTNINSGKYENDQKMDIYKEIVGQLDKMLQEKNVTDTEISAKITELKAAEDNLNEAGTVEPIDRLKTLRAEVKKAESFYQNLDQFYDDEARAQFTQAYEHALIILADPDSYTDEQIREAAETLHNAMLKLRIKPSKDALAALLAEVTKYRAEDYTAESYQVFIDAVAYAQNIYDKDSASEEEIQSALEQLQKAIIQLVEAGTDDVDKSGLKQLLKEAEGIYKDEYTQDSYAVLLAAIAEGRQVYNDDNASQEQVDTAVLKLKSAIDGLKKLDETDETEETDDTVETEETSETEETDDTKESEDPGQTDTDETKDSIDNTSDTGNAGKGSGTKTGDTTQLAVVIIMFAAASLLMGILLVNKRNK